MTSITHDTIVDSLARNFGRFFASQSSLAFVRHIQKWVSHPGAEIETQDDFDMEVRACVGCMFDNDELEEAGAVLRRRRVTR